MKRILVIALISFFCRSAFSQTIPAIKASEAKAYIGKLVYLKDKIQSGIVVTDSIIVLKVGGILDKNACSVIISSKGSGHSLDARFIITAQKAEAEFKGIVVPAGLGYVINIDGADKGRNIIFHGPFPK